MVVTGNSHRVQISFSLRWEACRSTRDSHRLTGDLGRSAGGPGKATGSGYHALVFAELRGEFITAHFRPTGQIAFPGDLIQLRAGLGGRTASALAPGYGRALLTQRGPG